MYIGPFFATFAISMFFLIMQFLWKYIDDLAGKGLDWLVVAELLFYASAHLVPLALPLAILLSSIMTFGSLAENYELMAAKSAGISLFNIFKPLLVILLFVAFGAFLFSNYTLPKSNLKFGALLWDVKTKKPSFDLQDGIFYKGIDDYVIRVSHKDPNTGELQDVLIYDHTTGTENNVVIRAKRGQMRTTDDKHWLFLTLYDGTRYEEIRNQKNAYKTLPENRTIFSMYEMRFDLSSFQLDRTDLDLFKGNFRMLNMKQLVTFHDSVCNELSQMSTKIRGYMRPYLVLSNDSLFRNGIVADTIEPDTSNLLALVPENRRINIIDRALSNSRSASFVLKNPATEYDFMQSSLARYEIEWHRKIVLSFIILVLFMIGAPLGAIIRKGGLGMPSVVSILLFLAYHIMNITGEKLARKGIIDAFSGMWLPFFILLPVGIFLVYKANKDSMLFNQDAYARLIRKINIFNRDKLNKTQEAGR